MWRQIHVYSWHYIIEWIAANMTVELTCPMIDVMNVSASKVLDICKIVGLEHSYVYIYKCGRWLDMDIQNLGKIWLISFFFFCLGCCSSFATLGRNPWYPYPKPKLINYINYLPSKLQTYSVESYIDFFSTKNSLKTNFLKKKVTNFNI